MGISAEQMGRLQELTREQRERLRERLAPKRLPGLALVAEGLGACGIRHLSGVTGTPIDKIFSEAAVRGIRPLGTRHQTTAALMAAAENYLSGRLEHAVLISAGPAVTNTMTGILYARDNHWPLLVLGGRRDLKNAGAGYFQELDAVPMLVPITKWAATVSRTCDIIPLIREACQRAIDGEPGPVCLDLPEDVLFDEAEPVEVTPPRRRSDPEAADSDVRQALHLLRQARRPLLCLGDGIRWSYDAEPCGCWWNANRSPSSPRRWAEASCRTTTISAPTPSAGACNTSRISC